MGVIGAFIGGGLGVLISHYLDQIVALFNPMLILPTEISSTQIAVIITSSIGLSLLCTLYPAYRAAKIEPAQALRYEK